MKPDGSDLIPAASRWKPSAPADGICARDRKCLYFGPKSAV